MDEEQIKLLLAIILTVSCVLSFGATFEYRDKKKNYKSSFFLTMGIISIIGIGKLLFG